MALQTSQQYGYSHLIVTRTHKTGDRDHVGLANGTAGPEEHLPRYFGKAGFSGNDPAQTKKQGSGKGNWYAPQSELSAASQVCNLQHIAKLTQ